VVRKKRSRQERKFSELFLQADPEEKEENERSLEEINLVEFNQDRITIARTFFQQFQLDSATFTKWNNQLFSLIFTVSVRVLSKRIYIP
jgi:hypothetical protein